MMKFRAVYYKIDGLNGFKHPKLVVLISTIFDHLVFLNAGRLKHHARYFFYRNLA